MTRPPRILIVAIVFTLFGAALASLAMRGFDAGPAGATAGALPQTREFTLDIVPKDLDMGGGLVWHAWTFNGTVPGPTLTATQGDRVRVTVQNSMDMVHSFHTHFSPYSLENDGSQLNTITGIGGMAMIPPNGSYTYEFVAAVVGVFYYHCHSADGGRGIHEHIAQGLYGAILVNAAEEPPVDDQVVFMAERGFDAAPGSPYYIMNGKGLPGGEHKLEEIFAADGVPGVVAQVGHTLPAIHARVGVPLRLNVINIGDAIHSFHLHGMTAYFGDGRPVPAQVLGLLPGEADRITVTPTSPGLWLYHCHVVSHADEGMIGLMIIQPREGQLDLPAPSTHGGATAHSKGDAGLDPAPDVPNTITASVGPGGELSFSPSVLELPVGATEVTFVNEGRIPHTFTARALGVDTGNVPPGGSRMITVTIPQAGSYEFECAVPGHAGGGMVGTLVAL